jgi:hypothetical protein
VHHPCTPPPAITPTRQFEALLDDVLGSHGTAEYFLRVPITCPRCSAQISEKTFVSVKEQRSFDLPSEEANVVFVDEATLYEAAGFVSGCEHCQPDLAELSFDQVLEGVTGHDPAVTEYVICHAARCPRCHHDVMEKTLVIAT